MKNRENDEYLKDITKDILTEFPEAIRIIKSKYITEEDWDYALDTDPGLFRYAKYPTLKMCRTAISRDGTNIFKIKNYSDFTEAQFNELIDLAVRTTPSVYCDLERPYQTLARRKMAVSIDHTMIDDVGALPKDFVESIIDEDPSAIQYIRNPDDDLKCIALKSNPNSGLYFGELSPKMVDVINECWPEWINVLPNYPKNNDNEKS